MFHNKFYTPLCLLLIIAGVLIAYNNIWHAGFINWDDPEYVVNNADIRTIDAAHIQKWFTVFYVGNYHPLTMFSYALDFSLGGNSPFIYHLANVVLHIATAVVLFAFVRNITGSRNTALFVSLLFALHPVQTETVSWVAERKNVLYGFFFMLSLYSYAKYAVNRSRAGFIIALIAGIAAMLSKGAGVSLPLTLFAVDIWLQRPLKNKNTWIEKLPFFIPAFVTGIIAVIGLRYGGYLNLHPELRWYETVVFSGYAYVHYIYRLLFPVGLSVLYPYPKEIGIVHFLFLLVATGMVYLAWVAYKKRWRVLLGGIVFYTANIIIVLQFVQITEVLMADHYLYIPSIGIWMIVADYLRRLLEKKSRVLVTAVYSTIVAGCLVLTYSRNGVWQSEQHFWEAILEKYPNSSVAQSSMGGVYLNRGDYRRALTYLNDAIETDRANYKAWYNKGIALMRLGKNAEALQALNEAIAIHNYTKALFARALLYQQTGQFAQAYADIEMVLPEDPQNARAYYIKAFCLEKQNNMAAAIHCYNKAIAYDAGEPVFFIQRGLAYAKTGKTGLAIGDLDTAISLDRENAGAWYWRGMIKHYAGQMPCSDLDQALRLGYRQAADAMKYFCGS